ncbi:AMP-binding protein [Halochromatium glycolicum]|uniref:Carrier domain-containing protein n=1 Tax=Halochromatium glycolicum TaxID=85075 RepID=A0AAJ0XAU5_9GAMM|nr:AMP-binding protein [Halochromatium glycolicum]MBK1705485.1 hypothetical protein [Halochromatium glycolicum]
MNTLGADATIIDALDHWARVQPTAPALSFLDEADGAAHVFSHADLAKASARFAAGLSQIIKLGEVVPLLYRPGPDFAIAFLGTLRAGAIAVPLPPLSRGIGATPISRFLMDCDARILVAGPGYLDLLKSENTLNDRVQVLDAAELNCDLGSNEVSPGPENIAFLQYTSGSTGTPRGVRVKHHHLLANQRMIGEWLGSDAQLTCLSWLPHYHDMGLVGGLLHPLFVGGQALLMSPAAFLRRPVAWLEAIERYRVNISLSPNFGLDYVLRRVTPDQRSRLDLSVLRVLLCGSEPVRAGTLENFAAAFSAAGFQSHCLTPCYGLAEATLFVAGHAIGEPIRTIVLDGRSLVGCGRAATGTRVAIVDPVSGCALPEGEIGEIEITGDAIADGYHGMPQHCFNSRFRTGDLGVVERGDLFVLGRISDLIIVRGRNIHPHDIEDTVLAADSDVRTSGTVAFVLEVEGAEEIVILAEVERRIRSPMRDIATRIARAVARDQGVRIDEVALVRASSIPKTTSGKLRRKEARRRYCTGEMTVLHRYRPPNFEAAAFPETGPLTHDHIGIENWLIHCLSRALQIDPERIDRRVPLADHGLDSASAVELAARFRSEFKIDVDETVFWEHPTLRDLVDYLAVQLER